MKKNFWPLYLIFASLGAAGIWTQVPRYHAALPEGLRHWCRDVVAKATGAAAPSEATASSEAPAPADAVDEVKPLVAPAAAPKPAVVAAQPPAPKPEAQPAAVAEAKSAEEIKPTEEPKPAAETKPEEPKPTEEPKSAGEAKPEEPKPDEASSATPAAKVNASDLPSMRGVQPADPKTATWGVVNRTTELVGLDGDYLGQVAGGRFFEIERRFRSEEGLMLVGNFWPKKLDAPVQAPAENFTCFSGGPTALTKKQLRALRKYYEARAEANDLRQELLKPKYDERTGREIKGPRVDPRKDLRHQELVEKMQEAAADIVGLAF